MNPKIIHAEELKKDEYGDTKVTTIVNDSSWPFSVAKVRKTGNNIKEGYDTESSTLYYVLEGKGTCIINGKTHHIKKGDTIIYPQGTSYKHLKGLTLLAISLPRFDRKKRVYLE
jgi:mannose-6-phosphate isomerase-like protein (cupin superfamily)